MLNVFRINHFAFDLRNSEVMDAFKKDPEAEMSAYFLSEEDKKPIREKNIQALMDAGINPNVMRSLCVAIGVPAVNVQPPRADEGLRLEKLQQELIASSKQGESQNAIAAVTSEQEERKKRIKEIETELKLVDPAARARR